MVPDIIAPIYNHSTQRRACPSASKSETHYPPGLPCPHHNERCCNSATGEQTAVGSPARGTTTPGDVRCFSELLLVQDPLPN
ncbi:hypothetical protein AAFF_G00388380 [Aldrovandia affinis]|uniref:Uncharacterized protein n=1 Tax=Aldrovandia affinis TaxID=143900 RepID=A0AAD7SGZ1_9TELE|nr:hypothetical protein AAFF_G00388380 [Aldrovandia affinis]